MNISANKSASTCLISEYLKSAFPDSLGENQSIVLAGGFVSGETVKVMTTGLVTESPDFSFVGRSGYKNDFHAIHRASTFEQIVIQSDDADVMVLLLYYLSKGKFGRVCLHACWPYDTIQEQRIVGSPPKHFGDWCSHTSGS